MGFKSFKTGGIVSGGGGGGGEGAFVRVSTEPNLPGFFWEGGGRCTRSMLCLCIVILDFTISCAVYTCAYMCLYVYS